MSMDGRCSACLEEQALNATNWPFMLVAPCFEKMRLPLVNSRQCYGKGKENGNISLANAGKWPACGWKQQILALSGRTILLSGAQGSEALESTQQVEANEEVPQETIVPLILL